MKTQKSPVHKATHVFIIGVLLIILVPFLLFGIQSARSVWEINQYKKEVARLHIPDSWRLLESTNQRNEFLTCIDISCPQVSRTYDPGKNYRDLPRLFQQVMTDAGYTLVYHDEQCGVKESEVKSISNSALFFSSRETLLCDTVGVKDGKALAFSVSATLQNFNPPSASPQKYQTLKNIRVSSLLTSEKDLYKPDSPKKSFIEVPVE